MSSFANEINTTTARTSTDWSSVMTKDDRDYMDSLIDKFESEYGSDGLSVLSSFTFKLRKYLSDDPRYDGFAFFTDNPSKERTGATYALFFWDKSNPAEKSMIPPDMLDPYVDEWIATYKHVSKGSDLRTRLRSM